MNLNHQRDYNRQIRRWLLSVFDYARRLDKKEMVRRNCPVCGSKRSEFFANNDFLDYEKCSDCSLVFMNPTFTAERLNRGFEGEDALLRRYFKIIAKHKTGVPAKPDPLKDNKLSDIYKIKRSGRLLDVGCSVGDFLHKAKHFYEVEGVEINPFTSAIAEKSFKVHKKYLSQLPFEKEFDIVTLHQVLYGIPDPVGLLKDIRKVLKDRGILYINTPNADSYAVDLYRGKVNHLYGYTTQNLFNRRSLETLASKTKFKLRSFRTEWLDVYIEDLIEFRDKPSRFIHKRNCQIKDYEKKIKEEDELHKKMNIELGEKGNYIVAVLEKA